ncbi:MAG TPA: hypothetical protein VFC56_16370 [Stellaceae bacterium]|nr:hypothetical protein [Stellaceae bacterium]
MDRPPSASAAGPSPASGSGTAAVLAALVTSSERRQEMGTPARKRALARHAPAAVIPQAVTALGLPARG